jgi:hypothetical protein
MRTIVALAGALLVLSPTRAAADAVAARADQLASSRHYKVRLSAALWLAQQHDSRAVEAMAQALDRDREHTVRRVAATSLATLVDDSTPAPVRDRAIAALHSASLRDRDRKVRKSAARAWRRLVAMQTPGRSDVPQVFVAVGEPTSQSMLAPEATRGEMQNAMRRALYQHAPSFGHSTRQSGLPSAADLRRSASAGFYVNASVSSVQLARRGAATEVLCQVSMRVSPWTGHDGSEVLRVAESASAAGKGRVRGGSARAAVLRSSQDCVVAVIEELTATHIVPFIKRTADRRLAKSAD